MKGILADLRHAFRLYLKTPAASALAVVVLAAAMAVVTALLSLWSDLELKSHPGFERSGDLITVTRNDGERYFGISLTLIERVNGEAASIEAIAGIQRRSLDIDRDGVREPLQVELVTSEYFPGIRPRLALGRGFDAADHAADAAPVAVLSDAFWQAEYDGRRDVLGETLWLHPPDTGLPRPEAEDEPPPRQYTIVGVMSPAIASTFFGDTALWAPFEAANPLSGAPDGGRGAGFFSGVARLGPSASVNAARAELAGRFGDAAEVLGIATGTMQLDAIQGIVRDIASHRNTLRQVRLFLGGGVLLALVAASNVSLFLLSRAPGRRRELSVRIAVGAPLKRLARQLVTESSLLVAAATALGVLASLWLTVAMRNLAFLRQAQWRDATPFDWRVLVLVVGFTLLLSVLVSLAPIAGIRRIGIAAGSRTITAHAGWGQRIAGTVQIVIAAVIGAAALAFVWYLGDLSSRERGFSAPNVIAVRFEAPRNRGPLVNPEAGLLEHERRRETIAAVPGIDSVAFGTWAPGTGSMLFISPTAPPDDPDDVFNVDRYVVDRAYFDMLGVRLLYGRALDDGERDGVVINATLARRLWGRTDVVGEILPPPRNAGQSGTEPPRWPVVGVVEDITFGHPSQSVRPSAFAALTNPTGFELALIETRSSVADIQRELQQRFDAGELDRKIELVQHVEDAWSQQLAPDRARMTLTLASAVLVVVLAAFGFYGTQRFLVAAGRREYAILAALGAGPRALGRLVLRRGLIQGVPGLVLGPVLAFIVVAWMRDDFVSEAVSPIVTAGSVAFGIVALLLAATIGPARQARDTDPGPLLKEE